MSEFKQIIGRGTRVRDDYGKLWFNIVDYTGSATRHFCRFDFRWRTGSDHRGGNQFGRRPINVSETEILPEAEQPIEGEPEIIEPPEEEHRKFYYDGGQVEIAAHLGLRTRPQWQTASVVRYTDYAAETVRTLCPIAQELRTRWANPEQRNEIIQALAERGISFEELAEQSKQPDADPFDLLCHLAFNAPLRTRRERAHGSKQERKDFFDKYSPEARQILDELLEKYAQHGDAQFVLPDVLHVPPISDHGQPGEIIQLFGSPEKLRQAVNDLQVMLYGS